MRLSLRGEEIIVNNQTLFSKFWYIGQICICPKIYQKVYSKRSIQPPLELEKIQPPRHLAKLSIWRGGLDIFDIDKQLIYIIKMHLKVIKSQQCSVERSHVVLKLILNSDQGLALFRQKQILTGLLVTKNLQKKWRFLYSVTLCLATFNQ